MVDCRNHVPGYEIPWDYHEVQSAIVTQLEAPDFHSICELSEAQQSAVNEIARLTDPFREKVDGDAVTAEALFESVETSLHGQPRLAGLGFFKGRYFAQLGKLEDAQNAFDDAATWFQFRSAVQLKSCLHYVLNISQMLGKRHTFAKWEGFCQGLDLVLDIQDANLAVARDFPNLFPEADTVFKSNPVEGYLIDLTNWENRPVDFRNLNRTIKGYGQTPTPQLALFAHLGQVDKVKPLLAAGADPNILDQNGGSALLNALQGGSDACFWTLLPMTSKEVINSRTKGGKSPLLEAISNGRADILQGLIDRGADVEMRGAKQQTALYAAVGQFADLTVFVREAIQTGTAGTDLPAFLRKTSSPFPEEEAHAQSLARYTEEELAILPELMKHFVKGDTAATRKIVQLLLDAGADVNALIEKEKLTPFLYAAEIGNPWLLKTLIDHGADLRSRDASGGNALSRLHFFGHSRLASDFLAWIEPSDRIWLGETPMLGR